MKRSIIVALTIVGCAWSCVPASAVVVSNAGFETVVPILSGGADDYGAWWGNTAQIITTENGVTPIEGTHMLKYLETTATSNLRQWLDFTSIPGGTEVVLSANVFRLPSTPNNAEFQLAFAALTYVPPAGDADFDSHTLGRAFFSVSPNVWTNISFSQIVPTGTVSLGIEVSYTTRGTLGGYSDNIRLTPEPSTLLLAIVGVFGLAAWRLRRKR